jgi:hypothetical protein
LSAAFNTLSSVSFHRQLPEPARNTFFMAAAATAKHSRSWRDAMAERIFLLPAEA